MDEEQRFLCATTAQNPVMSDTNESFGQDVQRKYPDEFLCIQCHDLLFTGIAIILVMKGHGLISDIEQSMIGDSDLVRVTP